MKLLMTIGLALVLCTGSLDAQITSAASGKWSAAATWVGGVVPSATASVVIADGHKVVIDNNITVASITVGKGTSGILAFDGSLSDTATVTGNVTVAAGGSFMTGQIATTGSTNTSTLITDVVSTAGIKIGMPIGGTGIAAGTTVTAFDATTITLSAAATATATGVILSIGFDSKLTIGGNLINNGIFDMSFGNTAGICNVTFNKAGDQTISGTGTTTRFRFITLDKAAVANKVIASIDVTTASSNLLYVAGTWEQTAGRLTAASGSLSIGSLTVTTAALNIIGSGSLRISSNLNVYGSFLMNSTDSVIVGFGAGTGKIDMTYLLGSSATYSKGTVVVYGKFASAALNNTTITGANIFIDPKAFAATDYAFRQTTGGGTFPLTFTSGTVTIVNSNNFTGANPELAMSSSIAPNISGTATYVLGQGANTVPSTQGFRISMNSTAVLNNLTMNSGTVPVTLQTNVTLKGKATFTSHGTLGGTGFFLRAPYYVYNGSAAQTIGSIVPDTVKCVTINNPAGVTTSKALVITDTLFLVAGKLSGTYTAGTTVSVTTDVKSNPEEIPQTFSLAQNYPNPFNPTTTLSFTVATRGVVTLKVYDILGKELATLANREYDAGSYSALWDASGFVSGMYIVVMRSGNFVTSQKMMLLK